MTDPIITEEVGSFGFSVSYPADIKKQLSLSLVVLLFVASVLCCYDMILK